MSTKQKRKNFTKNDARHYYCGNNRFEANQVCYTDVIVYRNNNFIRIIDIYDSNKPFGPYCCIECATEYEDLGELQ